MDWTTDSLGPYGDQVIQQLAVGHNWQMIVATRFLQCGFWVRVPPLRVRPTFQERHAFTDESDLFVHHRHRVFRFEVKARDVTFTDDPSSWKYPTLFVGTPEHNDKCKPTAYIFISQDEETRGSMIVVPMSARSCFEVVRTHNRKRPGYTTVVEAAPRSVLCRFSELVAWIHNPQEKGEHHDDTATSQPPW